jgi:hypothetical protein
MNVLDTGFGPGVGIFRGGRHGIVFFRADGGNTVRLRVHSDRAGSVDRLDLRDCRSLKLRDELRRLGSFGLRTCCRISSGRLL